jgi:SAM-dependent methyltransferase
MYRPDRWSLVQANVEAGLPFPSGCFDIVVCEQVLEHLHDPVGVAREMARVMRPGGLLIAGVPIFPPGLFAVRRHVVPLVDRLMGKARDHVQVFTSRRFGRLFAGELFEVKAKRGFRVVTGWPLGGLEDRRWWWRLNLAVGRAAPWICTEVQLVARRRQGSLEDQATVDHAPPGEARGVGGAGLLSRTDIRRRRQREISVWPSIA